MTAQSLPSADGDFIRGAGSAGPNLVPAGLSRVDMAILGGIALVVLTGRSTSETSDAT